MINADKWVHPTKFTGDYPSWNGYTWLDWASESKAYHPGDDYNFGYGSADLGQDVLSTSSGLVFHTSKQNTGYGNIVIIKHVLGYNIKRLIKQFYGIETDSLYSLYAHLQDITVKNGQEVGCGDLIGHVGNSGTTSPHLHFEIYSIWKDLKNVSFRFYPIEWSKEKIRDNWLPPYSFIETTKIIGLFDSFLGKPKEYWLQVEKDRESLLKQIGEKDAEFTSILSPLQSQIELLKNKIQQLDDEIAKNEIIKKSLIDQHDIAIKNLNDKINARDIEVLSLKSRITDILAQQSCKLETGELIRLLIEKLKSSIKRTK